MFEKAIRKKLRFKTDAGLVTVEDLWDLHPNTLNVIAKKLNKDLKNAEEEDFLKEKSKEDVRIKLKFDIVLHILKTKIDEAEKREKASDKKVIKEKLLGKLEKKQDEIYDDMSKEDLIKEIAKF